jgi:4'-phosphopantetheinyl transferase
MQFLLSRINQPDRSKVEESEHSFQKEARQSVLPFVVPRLRANEVHLWALIPDAESTAEYTSLLSPAEVERARRFRFPALFERFVSDHGRLRLLLAAYLQADPQSLQLVQNVQGKPRLSGPDCRLRFNMSHTRGLTMIAVCLDAELGIDVEVLRQLEERDEIAAAHFAPLEKKVLQAQPAEERDAAFLRCWTRKEAYIKAHGEGLSLGLDRFAVTLADQDRAALVHCDWDENEPDRWMLHHLQPMAGYIGALAIEQGAWSLRPFTWPANNS